jgi:hypothetical protein
MHGYAASRADDQLPVRDLPLNSIGSKSSIHGTGTICARVINRTDQAEAA